MKIKKIFFGTLECTNDRRLTEIVKAGSYSFVDPRISSGSLDNKLVYEKIDQEIGFLYIKGKIYVRDLLTLRGNFSPGNIVDLVLFKEKYTKLKNKKTILAPGDPFIYDNEQWCIPAIIQEGKDGSSLILDNVSESQPGYYSNVYILIKRLKEDDSDLIPGNID